MPAKVAEPERIRGGVAGLDRDLPPWRAWRTKSRAARAIRWIEKYCPIPSGTGTGTPIRLHPFQRDQLEEMLADGVRVGGVQIPRGNAKSTLWAAVALWALCDDPDAPQVPLIGFNGLSVQTTLWRPIGRMVSMSPELNSRVRVFKSSADRRALCAWNGGELLPLPAHIDRLQGLNPSIALVDEAQTVMPEVWSAIVQGAGKRSSSLVLAIGTPAPNGRDSALAGLRGQALAGANVAWHEHAAAAGCALDDRAEWARANPGIAAGLLRVDQLEAELKLVSEAEFRCYRLGQWVDAVVSDWLPSGAWEAAPRIPAPADHTDVILALAGTWAASVSIVGCTMDGELFVAYTRDDVSVSDPELEDLFARAAERWNVVEVVIAPRQRSNLIPALEAAGHVVDVWPNSTDIEVTSATEWRRAIVEGRVAHDHHPVLAQHISASVARSTSDGSLRLAEGDSPVDAARAARMAWWRARDASARLEAPAIW